jgi:hypothetical protein
MDILKDEWTLQDFMGLVEQDLGGPDTHEMLCYVCHDGGDLLCCDGCPRVGHVSCVGLSDVPEVNPVSCERSFLLRMPLAYRPCFAADYQWGVGLLNIIVVLAFVHEVCFGAILWQPSIRFWQRFCIQGLTRMLDGQDEWYCRRCQTGVDTDVQQRALPLSPAAIKAPTLMSPAAPYVSPQGRVHMSAPSARSCGVRRERNTNKHKRLFEYGASGALQV